MCLRTFKIEKLLIPSFRLPDWFETTIKESLFYFIMSKRKVLKKAAKMLLYVKNFS